MTMEDLKTKTPEHNLVSTAECAAAVSRSTWISLVVNIFLAVLQVLVGVFARSQGLIADGVHSLSDFLGDLVVLLISHHSIKAPDPEHPYGHHRFETAGSLALGILLCLVGAGMLWAALGKFEDPDTIPQVHMSALGVALAALCVKEVLFKYMLHVAQRVKSSLLIANAWHTRSDAASSLVVGLGIMGNLWGYPILDPIAALIVGLIIVRMGWKLGWNALNDLMDRAANDQEVQEIRQTLLETQGVLGVHDLRTRKMGDMIVVDVHLEVDASITVEAGHTIGMIAQQSVMRRHRVISLLTHIDPVHHSHHD